MEVLKKVDIHEAGLVRNLFYVVVFILIPPSERNHPAQIIARYRKMRRNIVENHTRAQAYFLDSDDNSAARLDQR